MKDQHTLIKGYRDLTQEEIDMMNKIKALGVEVGNLVNEIMNESLKGSSYDTRWVSIARTDLQKGFMSLVRSIARPDSF